jgi:TM2 domain-containing membrane protein YozV
MSDGVAAPGHGGYDATGGGYAAGGADPYGYGQPVADPYAQPGYDATGYPQQPYAQPGYDANGYPQQAYAQPTYAQPVYVAQPVYAGAYLWGALTLFGFAGFQHFYLGKPVRGVIWLLTWGLLGIGSLVDLFTLPELTRQVNARRAVGIG